MSPAFRDLSEVQVSDLDDLAPFGDHEFGDIFGGLYGVPAKQAHAQRSRVAAVKRHAVGTPGVSGGQEARKALSRKK